MSFLTDTDLVSLICSNRDWIDKNKIHIYPFSEESLTPVGYDLRVGTCYSSAIKKGRFDINEGQQIDISPGDTILVTTLEKVGMPRNRTISALIVSKVSKVSKGLSHISTSIDPDWDGKLLIAVHNHSSHVVSLICSEPFCTAVFFENKSPSTKDCGKPPERADVLLKEWAEYTQKARRKERIKSLVPISIILIMGGSGYLLFGNQPGFIAMTAIGVGLSQIASLIMKRY